MKRTKKGTQLVVVTIEHMSNNNLEPTLLHLVEAIAAWRLASNLLDVHPRFTKSGLVEVLGSQNRM